MPEPTLIPGTKGSYSELSAETIETLSINTGSGTESDRCLIIAVVNENTSIDTATATLNGVSLTEATTQVAVADENSQFFHLHQNAGLVSGVNDLVITYSADPADIVIHWATFQDVDPAVIGEEDFNTGQSDPDSVDVTFSFSTNNANSLILNISQQDTCEGGDLSMTNSASDTLVQSESSFDSGSFARGFSTAFSYQSAATAGSYNTGFNNDVTSNESWSILAIELLGTSGGGGTTPVNGSDSLLWDIVASLSGSESFSFDLYQSINDSDIIQWDNLAPVSGSESFSYEMYQLITDSDTIQWDVLSIGSISGSDSISWDNAAQVSGSSTMLYDVLGQAAESNVFQYDISAQVIGADTLQWDNLAPVSGSESFSYDLNQLINDSNNIQWDVLSIGSISDSDIISWSMAGQVGDSSTLQYDVLSQVANQNSIAWNQFEAVGDSDLLTWSAQGRISATDLLRWSILSLSERQINYSILIPAGIQSVRMGSSVTVVI